MGRVNITSSTFIFLQTPHFPVTGFTEIKAKKVMYIGTFTVHDLSKESLSGHIQCKKLKKVITTIFHHHTMFTGPLRCFHQLPAFFQCCCSRDFNTYMFAMLHCINCHSCMHIPWSAY